MRAILVLYMTRAIPQGGLGWSKEYSLSIYGWYTGLVYLTGVFGGYLADRYLGQRRSVFIGGTLIIIGHSLMAVPGITTFFCALVILIIGVGFFKPNISTMVGSLYQQGDPRRDAGFTIFYMGINIGAFIAPFICGTLGEKIGFHWGFAAAGIGMFLGQAIYVFFGDRYLGEIGKQKTKNRSIASQPLTKIEIDRMVVILVLSTAAIFFWAAYEQAGGLMTLFTDEKINRFIGNFQIPTSWFQILSPFFIIALGPVLSWIWTALATRGRDLSIPVKMALGLAISGIGFFGVVMAAFIAEHFGQAHLMWIFQFYLLSTVGELCLSPVGLSMVTKLAPSRFASLLMGFWFVALALGNKLSGSIGGLVEKFGERQLFLASGLLVCATAIILFFASRTLVQRMHESTP